MANLLLIVSLSAVVIAPTASWVYPGQADFENSPNEKPQSNYVSRPVNNNGMHNGNSNIEPVFHGFEPCQQRAANDLRSHPDDCSRFQMCTAGILIDFSCPNEHVFHEDSKNCVPKGSENDTCIIVEPTKEALICPPHATYKKAHPKECAQYYHCGKAAREMYWEDNLHECDYPMLYNINNKRCEHYSMVTCGPRREPLDPCDYKANECGSARCVPCKVRHPSCRGKQDGLQGWQGREGSPHYVVCAAQRVVYSGMCPQDHGSQIFDHESRTCVLMNAKQSFVRHHF